MTTSVATRPTATAAGAAGMDRVRRLTERMRAQGIDLLVTFKPEHSFYLSGFNPIIYSHPVVAVLGTDGQVTLLVHALRDDHARGSSWVSDIRLYGRWSTKKTLGMSWLKALADIVAEKGAARGVIGVEEDWMPAARLAELRSALKEARFKDTSRLFREVRTVKDADEIANLRIAADLADHGMAAAIEALAAGGSERRISIQAMAAMNRRWNEAYPAVETCDFGSLEGGVQNGLWCWCLAGERVAFNCDNPTTRVPAKGELALILIWTVANGIHAEIERTVAVGPIDDARRRAFEAVLEIRERSYEAIRPGRTCAELFNHAKAHYERLGYGAYLPGRIGHGMGLGCHEEPSLGPDNAEVFVPGMVTTFEPNLRIPEWGGLQHSDTVLIEADGFEFVTTYPRGLLTV